MHVISMRGQKLDMGQLIAINSQKKAIGNAGLNARGDRVAKNGTVVQTREQVLMTDYNVNNPKAVRQVGLNDIRQEVFLSPKEAVDNARQQAAEKRAKRKIID